MAKLWVSRACGELADHVLVGPLRNRLKRLDGYRVINPWNRQWHSFPARRMRRVVQHVFQAANIQVPVGVLLEPGCGTGRHYSRMLKTLARKVIGFDLLPPQSARFMDEYFQVAEDLQASYFPELPDQSVDVILVLTLVGMDCDHPVSHVDWLGYFSNGASRQGRYFTPQNLLRVLKPGGHLVVIEWEACPESRFGKHLSLEQVQAEIDRFYPHPEIPGLAFRVKGFAPEPIGPYIVYRKADG